MRRWGVPTSWRKRGERGPQMLRANSSPKTILDSSVLHPKIKSRGTLQGEGGLHFHVDYSERHSLHHGLYVAHGYQAAWLDDDGANVFTWPVGYHKGTSKWRSASTLMISNSGTSKLAGSTLHRHLRSRIGPSSLTRTARRVIATHGCRVHQRYTCRVLLLAK